jgi:aerobic C4-dicarboxylate transport protein
LAGSIGHQLTLPLVLLLTSKNAASVSGGTFIVMAATLRSVPGIPVAVLVLVFGIYRFISEGGALINVIGNGIATIVVVKWERRSTATRLNACSLCIVPLC